MAAHETAFMTNPISFLKLHTLSPPDESAGHALHSWDIENRGNILSGGGERTSTVNIKSSGISKQYAQFVPHLFPGCLTVKLRHRSARSNSQGG